MKEAVISGAGRESPPKEALSRAEDLETVLRDREKAVRHGTEKAEQDLPGARDVLREAREDLIQEEEKAEDSPEETVAEASVREEEEMKMIPYLHRN